MSQRLTAFARRGSLTLDTRFLYALLFAALICFTPTGANAQDAEVRIWSNSTGKFKIQARFISIENGKVTLEKEDGDTVEIDLKKLSAADQKYVAEMQAAEDNPFKSVEENPFQSSSPNRKKKMAPVEDEEPSSDTRTVRTKWNGARTLSLVPKSSTWKVPVSTVQPPKAPSSEDIVGLPEKNGFFEKVQRMVLSQPMRRVVVGYVNAPPGDAAQTRLVMCDIEKGSMLGVGMLPGSFIPEDYHDDGLQVLMRRSERGAGSSDKLEIWRLGRSGIERTVECSPFESENQGDRDVKWARFLDNDRLITVSSKGKLALIDLKTGQVSYSFNTQDACVPDLSSDRKLLAFTTGKELGILDVDAGRVIAMKQIENVTWPMLKFSPSGRRLAVASHGTSYIFDVASGELYREIKGQFHGDSVVWPDEDHLMLGKSTLTDLENQVKLWTYRGGEDVIEFGGLCYFVVDDWQKKSGAIVPAQIPGPAVLQTVQQAMADPNFFILKPGTTVRLDGSAIQDAAQREIALGHLAKKLEANGFKVGSEGTITLVAGTGVGQEQTVQYRTFGQPPFGGQEYKIREYISALKFEYQGKQVWETRSVNVPHFLSLKQGQTVQDALREYEKPNYQFFESVELPKLLTQKDTIGSSDVTTSGVRSS